MQENHWYLFDPEYHLYFSLNNGQIFRSEFDQAIPFKTYEDVMELKQSWPRLEVYYIVKDLYPSRSLPFPLMP